MENKKPQEGLNKYEGQQPLPRLIELTKTTGEKFRLNSQLIEGIWKQGGGGSLVRFRIENQGTATATETVKESIAEVSDRLAGKEPTSK